MMSQFGVPSVWIKDVVESCRYNREGVLWEFTFPPDPEKLIVWVSWDIRADRVIIKVLAPNFKWVEHHVRVTTQSRRGRERFYFVCPVILKAVERLYYRNGRFASRVAQGLLYETQKRSHKERDLYKTYASDIEDWRALEEGEEAGSAPSCKPRDQRLEWEKVFAAEDRRRELAARALARSHVMDTRSAMDRANAEGLVFDAGQIHSLIEDANPDGEHARDIAAYPLDDDVPIGIWEDHPRLDLRMLASAGLMRPGELTGTTLLWDFEEGWDRVDVYIDLRRGCCQRKSPRRLISR